MQEDQPPYLEKLAGLFKLKVENIAMFWQMEDHKKALEDANFLLHETSKLIHRIKLHKAFQQPPTGGKEELYELIKVAQRHLGELEDWIFIDKKEAQHKSLYELTETVDELNKRITKN